MRYFNHTIAIRNLNIPPFQCIIPITEFEFITIPYHYIPVH